MQDEKATRSRNYAISMSDELSKEIRGVAASMGLPVSKVRAIVSEPFLDQLSEWEGNVRHFVGLYFAKIAGETDETDPE